MFEIIRNSHTNRIKIPEFPIKIDLGCGKTPKEGCIGFDKLDFGQEIVWDINMGIPVPDDSVSYIHTSHFVEHLDSKQIELLWVEMARICRDGAIIEGRCPHSGTIISYYACHHSLWNEDRLRGLCQGDMGHGKFRVLETRIDENELHFRLEFNHENSDIS